MTSYSCLTASEWRNLCSIGRIRIHESRVILARSDPVFFHELFSLAPDRFAVGETSDFLLVELLQLDQSVDGFPPPGSKKGVYWLTLDRVVRFFPIQGADAWAFDSDAQKAQITIGAAEFELNWKVWSKDQLIDQACMNGFGLIRSLEISQVGPKKCIRTFDQWRNIAFRSIETDTDLQSNFDFSDRLLAKKEELFELVRTDLDFGAIFISCPIEWINLNLDANILESDSELADIAEPLYEKYLNSRFDVALVTSDDLCMFEASLQAKFPDFFPEEWSPVLITLFVRLSHLIRFGSIEPNEIIAAVGSTNRTEDQRTSKLLAFLLGVTLGANKIHSLERLLNQDRFAVAISSFSKD
jgi:hypothetical protein